MTPGPARFIIALSAATLCAVAFGGRTYLNFTPVRHKLIRTPLPANAGAVVAAFPAETSAATALGAPFAAIVTVRNDAADPHVFRIDVDGGRACESEIPGRSRRRVDCAVSGPLEADRPHQLSVRSDAPQWTTEYAEVATHFGSSHQFIDLYVLPVGRPVASPGPMAVAGLWITVCLILIRGPRVERARATRTIQAGVVALSVLMLAAVALAPWMTQYRIVLSIASSLLLSAGVMTVQAWSLGTIAWRDKRLQQAIRTPRAGQALASVIVVVVFGSVMAHQLTRVYSGNYSGFVRLAADTVDRNPQLSARPDIRQSLILSESGYDGQFMYFATFDPFMLAHRDNPDEYAVFVDFPPYRFGRIGFSLLTKAVSLDRWQWYPAAMVWLVLAGVFGSAWALARIALDRGASPFWSLLILLVPGFWESLQAALPEPLSAAFLLAGYWATTREKWAIAIASFAGALLIRETGAVFVGIMLVSVFLSGRRRHAIPVLLGSALPLALWRTYVGVTFYHQFGWRAFLPAPPDLTVPLLGIIDTWRAIAAHEYLPPVASAAMYFSILLVGAFALAAYVAWKRPGAVSLAALVYGLIAISLNYKQIWVHVGNAQRGTFEVFLWLAVCSLPFLRVESPRAETIAVRTFWVAVGAYLLFGSLDAGLIRQAILPI